MMLQNAEMNRDRKRNRKPFTLENFCFYGEMEEKNAPSGRYGACAMALIKRDMLPPWALFVYQDLKKNAVGSKAPDTLSYQCEDAIILGPQISDSTCRGMLIARKSASNTTRTMISENNEEIRVIIPQINSTIYADEEAILTILYVK